MPLDDLPGKLIVPTRDDLITRYKRDYVMRVPGGHVDVGTQVDIDARLIADVTAPIYANAARIANSISRQNRSGVALDADAVSLGTTRLPASKAYGYVQISASSTGGTIPSGTVGVISGYRYEVTATALYVDKDWVPVRALDAGTQSNQSAGALLSWLSPPAGIGPQALVVAAADGTGLTGGGNAESDEDLRRRLIKLAGDPPVSGNDAEYRKLVLETPGLPVEAAFTYPGILSSGTTSVVFTTRGDTRIPTGPQIAAARAYVEGLMPASDVPLFATLLASPTTVALRVTWHPRTIGWANGVPWPANASTVVVSATDATLFVVNGPAAPGVGHVFGLWDSTSKIWRRKRVRSVLVSGSNYTIACDSSFGASDTSYVPVAGQLLSPWSDSLSLVSDVVLSEIAKLGPGEQTGVLVDYEQRMRRSPPGYQSWPSALTSRFAATLSEISSVSNVLVESPSIPYETPVGVPGSVSRIITLGDLHVRA